MIDVGGAGAYLTWPLTANQEVVALITEKLAHIVCQIAGQFILMGCAFLACRLLSLADV